MVAINTNVMLSLGDVFSKVMSLDRVDYAVPSGAANIISDTNDRFHIATRTADGYKTFGMTPYARGQFNDRWTGFNTFSKTLDKNGSTQIYLDTANALLAEDDRKMVLRTIEPDGERVARAVVSDAFKPIDDNLLIPNMVEVIGDRGHEWRALGGQVTDTNTFMRFITRQPQMSLNVNGRNREMHVGFQYSNSEVGRGFAQFSAFFFDSFCENGCVFGSLNVANVKHAHRGSRISTDFGQIFEERIQKAELAQIQGAIVDATRLAVEGTYVPEVKQLLERALATEIPAESNEVKFIEEVARRVGLTQAEQQAALVEYDGTRSIYGVQAAITALAQKSKDFSRRAELEQAGGRVIQMDTKVWDSIATLCT